MKNFFLKMKHWQLTLLLVVLPIAIHLTAVMSDSFRQNIGLYLPIVVLLTIGSSFAWFWSIGAGLKHKLPEEVKLNFTLFKAFLIIASVYLVLFFASIKFHLFNYLFEQESAFISFISLGLIMVLFMFVIFTNYYSIYYILKTVKSVELQKQAKFSDFTAEFLLLIFLFPIGIWFVQPTVNRLIKE